MELALVDPGFGCLEWVEYLVKDEGMRLGKILLTHSHFDHTASVPALVGMYEGVEVFVHEKDALNVVEPGSDGILDLMGGVSGLKQMFGVQEGSEQDQAIDLAMTGVAVSHYLREGESVRVGNVVLEVIETPGHSPGGVCFYLPTEKVLLAGDTLMRGTHGRLDLPGCNEGDMAVSFAKLAKLPDDTTVYCGHGSNTTIGHERFQLQ